MVTFALKHHLQHSRALQVRLPMRPGWRRHPSACVPRPATFPQLVAPLRASAAAHRSTVLVVLAPHNRSAAKWKRTPTRPSTRSSTRTIPPRAPRTARAATGSTASLAKRSRALLGAGVLMVFSTNALLACSEMLPISTPPFAMATAHSTAIVWRHQRQQSRALTALLGSVLG